MNQLYKLINELRENGAIKLIDIGEIIENQLQISRKFVDQKEDIYLRIATILSDNIVEIMLKNMTSYDFRLEDNFQESQSKKFKELLKNASDKNKIDNYQKFVFLFIHQKRNVYYHEGIPIGIEYALKVPDLMDSIVKIHFNFTCDLVISLGYNWTITSFHSKDEFNSKIKAMKYNQIIGKEFEVGTKVFLRFFTIKWNLLTEMTGYIMEVSSMPYPDIHFKWGEFFRRGGRKRMSYRFESQEKFERDYKKFRSKFKYNELVGIGKKIIKSFQIIENVNHISKERISHLLIEINSLLENYEDIIYFEFGKAEEEVERRVDDSLLEEYEK